MDSPKFSSNLKNQSVVAKYNVKRVIENFPKTNQRIMDSKMELLDEIEAFAKNSFQVPKSLKTLLGARQGGLVDKWKIGVEKKNEYEDEDGEDDLTIPIAFEKKVPFVQNLHNDQTKKVSNKNADKKSMKVVVKEGENLNLSNVKKCSFVKPNNVKMSSITKPNKIFNEDDSHKDKNLKIWKSHQKNTQNKIQESEQQDFFNLDFKQDSLFSNSSLTVEDISTQVRNTLKLVQEQNKKENHPQTILIQSDKSLGKQTGFGSHIQDKNENSVKSESESDYSMTSYSSNQSSNNKSHKIIEIWEDFDDIPYNPPNNKPLNLFLNKTNSFNGLYPQLNLKNNNTKPNLSFNPLHNNTPKKSNKKRRLYCRQKKIPRWAEDLSTVFKVNEKINPYNIFGIPVIHGLNIDYIFPHNPKKNRIRTSEMKWNPKDLRSEYDSYNIFKKPQLQVIKEKSFCSDNQ